MTRLEFIKIRNKHGLTQEKFAKATGMSGPHVNTIEKGKCKITQLTIDKVTAFDGGGVPAVPREVIFERQSGHSVEPVKLFGDAVGDDEFEIVAKQHVPLTIETPNGFKIHFKGTFKQAWKHIKNL